MSSETLAALTREYPAGTILFEENDPAARMYVIRSGRVRIFRRHEHSEIVLAFLGPGDFFGEMALLEGLPRSATAEVMETSRLVEVDGTTFEEMLRASSEIAVRMMRRLAARLRESDGRVESLLQESALARALEVLRWLSAQGVPEGKFVRLRGAMHQVDLATQAGIPPAQAAGLLKQLERAGCVQFEQGDLLIANPTTLDEFGSFLDLKRKYEHAGVLSTEANGAEQDDRLRAMQRLLSALKLAPTDLERRQQALAHNYRRFVELSQRFKFAEGLPE